MLNTHEFANNRGVTHIVTEITWGAHVTVIFDRTIDKSDEQTEQSAGINAQTSWKNVGLSAGCKKLKEKEINTTKYTIDIKGGCVPKPHPTNIDGVYEMVSNLKSHIGEGVEISFGLTPIREVLQNLNQSTACLPQIQIHATDEEFVKKVQNTFDEHFLYIREMDSSVELMKRCTEFITSNDVDRISQYKVILTVSRDTFSVRLV